MCCTPSLTSEQEESRRSTGGRWGGNCAQLTWLNSARGFHHHDHVQSCTVRLLRTTPLENAMAPTPALLTIRCLALTAMLAPVGLSQADTRNWIKSPDTGNWIGLTDQPMDWASAEAVANALGGNLVTIRSQAENDFLSSTYDSELLWIGLNDISVEGQFKWSSGEPVGFVNWYPGEPDDGGGAEDWGHINIPWLTSTGLWGDSGPSTSGGSSGRGALELPAVAFPWTDWMPPFHYPVESGLQGLPHVLSDVDKDGDLDIVTANYGASTLTVLLNSGDGYFLQQTVTATVGSGPLGVVVVDLNGDGDLDLASNCRDSNLVSLHWGDGLGGFAPGATGFSIGTVSTGLAAEDLDLDGDVDLLVGCEGTGEVQWALNNGVGSFGPVSSISIPGASFTTPADLDGDTFVDFAVSSDSSGKVHFLESDGQGGLEMRAEITVVSGVPWAVAFADFNSDGVLDLAVPLQNAGMIEVRLGSGTPFVFGSAQTTAVAGDPHDLCVADLDADGKLDIAVASNSYEKVQLLLGDGTGAFPATAELDTAPSPISVAAGDLDGDGVDDLTVLSSGTSEITVYKNLHGPDCNGNGIPDALDILWGLSPDPNDNGIPEECESSVTTYCSPAAPNTVSATGAKFTVSGIPSTILNDMQFEVINLPVNLPGIFFYGPFQAQLPFGNGFVCVGGSVNRVLPALISDAIGTVRLDVDLTKPPFNSGPGQIVPGSTWNFQYWYRDPAGFPTTFNLSDAVELVFAP